MYAMSYRIMYVGIGMHATGRQDYMRISIYQHIQNIHEQRITLEEIHVMK